MKKTVTEMFCRRRTPESGLLASQYIGNEAQSATHVLHGRHMQVCGESSDSSISDSSLKRMGKKEKEAPRPIRHRAFRSGTERPERKERLTRSRKESR
jgi:hypothetical protein